jgi:MoxR-like ATPase
VSRSIGREEVIMRYPYFQVGLSAEPVSIRSEDVPTLDRSGTDDPRHYVPDPDLSHAVNVALLLGMPLLVTGEPGTGKTQLASVVADALQCPMHRFETKSTSGARDLFYAFDAITSFKMRDVTDQRRFITYQALGRAILDAFPAAAVAELLPTARSDYVHRGPRRSVVLIDEIDKAPRDFPNDLLNEIERLYFRISELGNVGTPGADAGSKGMEPRYRPIVIITSNSEKGLPDPFLRRCIYYDIPFPKPEQMEKIVAGRITDLTPADPLLSDALDLFYRLRHEKRETSLRKEPSTAELLNWLQVLMRRRAVIGEPLRKQRSLVLETLSTLVKGPEDRREAEEFIKHRWSPD